MTLPAELALARVLAVAVTMSVSLFSSKFTWPDWTCQAVASSATAASPSLMRTTLSGRTFTTLPVKKLISAPDPWSVCTTSPVASCRYRWPFVQTSVPTALTRTLPSTLVKRATAPAAVGGRGFRKKTK